MPDPPVVPLLPIEPKLVELRVAQGQSEIKELRQMLDHDMRGLWVGFIEPARFTHIFLDKPPNGTLPPKLDISSSEGLLDHQMYGVVLNAVTQTCPNLPIYVTAHARQKQLQFCPDGAVAYHPMRSTARSALVDATATDVRPKKQKKSSASKRATKKASDAERPADTQLEHVPFDWHAHGLMFEFKSKSEQDPFYSYQEAKAQPEPTIAKADDESCQTLGQLAECAATLLNHQHRTHLFQILICGDTAHFIYWDRAGAVVSDKFNFREEKELLPQFLWRYQHMSASRRGWDETALKPSTEEVEEFRVHVEQLLADMRDSDSAQRPIAHAEDTLDDSYPPYKLVVNPGKVGKHPQELIVQRPTEVVLRPTGRTTRGYIAWSVTEKRLVFLKDSWRMQINDLDKEDNIYATLIEAEVPGLPTVICAGDVSVGGVVQKTRAQNIARRIDLARMIPSLRTRTHFHHRVVQELAYSLVTAVDSKEYTIAFRDAFRTLEKAHDAGILHRDISFNNIMLDANGKVVVNDWDHACVMVSPAGSPIKLFRTGTWPFMSIALLENLRKTHDLLDDYESLLWSMLFGALKYIKGDITLGMLAFYDRNYDGLQMLGGGEKSNLLYRHRLSALSFDSTPLGQIFKDLAASWRSYYGAEGALGTGPNMEDAYENIRSRLLGGDFWYNIIDPIVTNPEGWQENDLLIEDRYPLETRKVIGVRVRKLVSPRIVSTKANVTQSMQRESGENVEGHAAQGEVAENPSAGRGSSSNSPLSDLPDPHAAPPFAGTPELHEPLVHDPGHSSSALDSDGNSGRGPPLSSSLINLSRKRALSVHQEDDDAESSAEPSSPLPRAKRLKKATEGSAASSSARPRRCRRTRTRCDPPVPTRRSSRLQKLMCPAIQ